MNTTLQQLADMSQAEDHAKLSDRILRHGGVYCLVLSREWGEGMDPYESPLRSPKVVPIIHSPPNSLLPGPPGADQIGLKPGQCSSSVGGLRVLGPITL